MARPPGSRNLNYDPERTRLATLVLERLMMPEGAAASLRALAAHCQVSPPTLRHYFRDREGAIEAALERALTTGQEHLEVTAKADLGPARQALTSLLRLTVLGWERFGVGDLMRCGLELGLGHERLGPAYVNTMLEPLLQAFEQRLMLHQARGELVAHMEPRLAALLLVSPLVMALLHQRELGGQRCRPLDLEALISAQLHSFMLTYGEPGEVSSTASTV